ncbi:hypothetical protein BU16DRAFT_538967 [Lophium mytilinum]|uniref:SAP domain-containing protein n=1 Tax=Lophium mytilinum TaxID=390894 RepID=A0A6A6QV93_9PEZI|nr:hypothetical protein BU16DRAFT_538967 [Lophium mytilinum]
MPRTKRPLAESDPNASSSRRTRSKVAKSNESEGVENAAPIQAKKPSNKKEDVVKVSNGGDQEPEGYASKTNGELAFMLRERGLPYNGIKSVLIGRLEDFDEKQKSNISKPGAPGGKAGESTSAEPILDEGNSEADSLRRQTDFASKDNSKLRLMLEARKLPVSGTRDELIARLEQNPIVDYDQYTPNELSAMAMRRKMRQGAAGPKASKIARLRQNDELKRDTGNSQEDTLYIGLSSMEMIMGLLHQEQVSASRGDYSFVKHYRNSGKILDDMLTERNLSDAGTMAAKMDRLRADDAGRETPFVSPFWQEKVKPAQAEWDQLRLAFEAATGRTLVSARADLNEEDMILKSDPLYAHK